MYFLYTVKDIETFEIRRVLSPDHNRVHETDLQPRESRQPDQVAVDETATQLDEEHYWLYAAAGPDLNEPRNTEIDSSRTNTFAQALVAEIRKRDDGDDVSRNRGFLVSKRDASCLGNAVFLLDGVASLKDACQRYGLAFEYERHGN